MTTFESSEVQLCASILSDAKTPDDALLAWSMLRGRHSDLIGIVSLDQCSRSVLPSAIKKYTKPPLNYLVPYFETENIYFLEDNLLREMLDYNAIRFGVDYTLMLDTNIVSYINKLVRGESIGSMQNKIIPLIDGILHDDLNFDSLFYMIENIKIVSNSFFAKHKTKISFWKSLNKEFRSNLVSFQIFRSIDCKEYKRTSNPKPIFTHRDAVRRAVKFSHDFYNSTLGEERVFEIILTQRLILLQLLGMVKIQLSSNKSADKKMNDYFDYIHSVVGAYFDRETIIAHKYFLERKNVGILNKFQKGMPIARLLKKLDNIAWDMAAPRFMETLISSSGTASEGRYLVPMFVSFDTKLREVLSLFPVKGAIFNKINGKLISLPKVNTMDYFHSYGCGDKLEYLYSEPVKTERMSRPIPTRASVHECIRKEFRELRRVITGNNKPKLK